MSEEGFAIQELCDQTGVPRRTIHFYIQQEILPPPDGSGLGARYRREHLLRLKLIPILRQQGLRLDDIRVKFKNASLSELEQLIAKLIPGAKDPPPPAGTVPLSGSPSQMYTLPGGIVILVPNTLSAENRKKAQQLLQTAQILFTCPPSIQ
jgi:DNA-binding transcriptional MerR regulator